MSKESWYASKPEGIIRIDISEDFIVDYDKTRGMYRVSIFEDGHYLDEFWFDAFEETEVDHRVEKIVDFLENLKRLYKITSSISKNRGIVPDPLDFRSDEEKAIDLLDSIMKYIKYLENDTQK